MIKGIRQYEYINRTRDKEDQRRHRTKGYLSGNERRNSVWPSRQERLRQDYADAGDIRTDPSDKRTDRDHKNISIPRSIGLLLENPSLLPEYDASQNLKLLAKMQGGVPEDEIRQLIRDVGLEDAGHKKVEKYSLGMKQRLGIAAAILGSPDIILLDEPINAIDGEGVEEIRSLILSLKNEKRIIIVACHDKEEMNLLADEIVHLRNGRIEGQENGGAA